MFKISESISHKEHQMSELYKSRCNRMQCVIIVSHTLGFAQKDSCYFFLQTLAKVLLTIYAGVTQMV